MTDLPPERFGLSPLRDRRFVEVQLDHRGAIVNSLITLLGWTRIAGVLVIVVGLVVLLIRESSAQPLGLGPEALWWLDNEWLGTVLACGLAGVVLAGIGRPALRIPLKFLTYNALISHDGFGLPLHAQRLAAQTRHRGAQMIGFIGAIVGGLFFVVFLAMSITMGDDLGPVGWILTVVMLAVTIAGGKLFLVAEPDVRAENAAPNPFVRVNTPSRIGVSNATQSRIDEQVAQRRAGPAPYDRATQRYHRFSWFIFRAINAPLAASLALSLTYLISRYRCRYCDPRSFDEPLESVVNAVSLISGALMIIALVALVIAGIGLPLLNHSYEKALRTMAQSDEAEQWRPSESVVHSLVSGPSDQTGLAAVCVVATLILNGGLAAVLIESPLQPYGWILTLVGLALLGATLGILLRRHRRRFADRALYRSVWPAPDPLPTSPAFFRPDGQLTEEG